MSIQYRLHIHMCVYAGRLSSWYTTLSMNARICIVYLSICMEEKCGDVWYVCQHINGDLFIPTYNYYLILLLARRREFFSVVSYTIGARSRRESRVRV